jgi:hypothetical protein
MGTFTAGQRFTCCSEPSGVISARSAANHRQLPVTARLLSSKGAVAVTTAMKGFLRRLRGGVAGVPLIFDIDSPRERNRLRALHLGCLSLRMPAFPSRVPRVLLAALWPMDQHSSPSPIAVGRLIRTAHGRPGWIRICALLARDPKYWCAEGVKVRALALDSELQLRRTSPLEPTQKRHLLSSTLN